MTRGWRLTLAVGVVVAMGGCGHGSTAPLSHRDFLKAVEGDYYPVADPHGAQALATPVQMTDQVAAFIAAVTGLRVTGDDVPVRDGIVTAARNELAALCEMPPTRADAMSDQTNLDAHCPALRPQYRSLDSATALLMAERALDDAVNRIPVQ